MDLNYIINHVFLPPKLPQKDDSSFLQSVSLTKELQDALAPFQDHLPDYERPYWSPCIKMVRKMLGMRDQFGEISTEALGKSLESMLDGDILSLHIRSQNAGLIIRRGGEQISFESFELSPTTKSVIGTMGRLRRYFPGPAQTINRDRLSDARFVRSFVELVAQLDAETPIEVRPVVSKARSSAIETRDTVDPRFVTEMLMGFLRGIGQPRDVDRIWKHTRDDVVWKDALAPWRRSPHWLLLRVTLQTSLCNTEDEANLHGRYKSFMVFFMARILERALRASRPSDILFIMAAKISRRVLKLNDQGHMPWLEYVQTTVEAVHQVLADRWSAVERNPDPTGILVDWDRHHLQLVRDSHLTLSTFRPYLRNILARTTLPPSYCEFKPDCTSRIPQYSSKLPGGLGAKPAQ